VVVPDEIAESLARKGADRGTSAEAVAAEVLKLHVPGAPGVRPLPALVGAFRSGR
jgi:hypothetical protein